MYTDVVDTDVRMACEFILRHKPYTESELLRKDVLTFFRLISECEDAEREQIERLQKQD